MNEGSKHCTGVGEQNHPEEKKCKMAKWLPEEALKEKRRKAKGKGEKERYTHLNAEFQRIARTDKKALLSDQCKKQRKTKDWERLESLQENQRYQENISCKDGHNKGHKLYELKRSK